MIGKLTFPGHLIDLVDGEAQLEFIIERPGQGYTAGSTRAYPASGKQGPTEGNSHGGLLRINPHHLENPVDRLDLLRLLALLVPRHLGSIVLEDPSIHTDPFHRGHGFIRNRRDDGRHSFQDKLISDQYRLAQPCPSPHGIVLPRRPSAATKSEYRNPKSERDPNDQTPKLETIPISFVSIIDRFGF